jgi:hypothetical protein
MATDRVDLPQGTLDLLILRTLVIEPQVSTPWQVEGRPSVTLRPGDVLFIPAGAVHSATNVGDRKGAELATYIVEKGKPLFTDVGVRAPR